MLRRQTAKGLMTMFARQTFMALNGFCSTLLLNSGVLGVSRRCMTLEELVGKDLSVDEKNTNEDDDDAKVNNTSRSKTITLSQKIRAAQRKQNHTTEKTALKRATLKSATWKSTSG